MNGDFILYNRKLPSSILADLQAFEPILSFEKTSTKDVRLHDFVRRDRELICNRLGCSLRRPR